MSVSPPAIEAEKLNKFYGSFAAIRNVSFSIPKGQVVAFLGPNGAGKSTTMKILTGYMAPTSGVARIMGQDVSVDRVAVANHVGYLPENGPLYADMTPRTILQFLGEARGLSGCCRDLGRPPICTMGDLKAARCQAMVPSFSDTTLLATPALISDWAPMMLRVRPPQLTITIVSGDGTKSLKR